MHIEYTVTFTARDHRNASRLMNRRKGWLALPALFGLFLWIGLTSSDPETPPLSLDEVVLTSVVVSLGLWGVFGMMTWLALWLESWWITKFIRHNDCQVTVVLDDDGVTQTNAEWKTWDSWKRMKRFREDRHLFLVFGAGQHYMIPKRMLSDEQIELIREWLMSKVA